jgi:hypothetical protein
MVFFSLCFDLLITGYVSKKSKAIPVTGREGP